MEVLIVNSGEPRDKALKWTSKFDFNFPILLDVNSVATEAYCPPNYNGDLPKNQVPIASNMIIDPEGVVRFNLLLDSKNFDAKLIKLKAKLDQLLAAGKKS